MLDLVIFDADGVLFDSTESNTAYYNAIFDLLGEVAMSPDEEKAGVFLSAPQVFELRAAGDAARIARMREVARTMDSTPFFKMLRPHPELRSFLLEYQANLSIRARDQSFGDDPRNYRLSWARWSLRCGSERARQGAS